MIGKHPIPYRDLVADVAYRTGLDFGAARTAAEATVTVLARSLDGPARQRLLGAVPAELHDEFPVDVGARPWDLRSFLDQVGPLTRRPPEQVRYQAQAVLSAIAERDRDLIEQLDPPAYLRELFVPPPVGGGLVDPAGHTPPLAPDELRTALSRLPRWSGDRRALVRTVVLPPDSLDRVLQRLDRLRREGGRGPHVARRDPSTAVLILYTSSVDAVSAQDVDLAHRVDAAIEEAGAGLAG